MQKLHELSPRARRRHARLLRRVLERGRVYVRGESLFRMAERLHKAGKLTAQVTKWNLLGIGNRSFRELVLKRIDDLDPHYPVLPRG